MFEIGKKGTPEAGPRPESSPARTESSPPRSSAPSSREAAVIGPSIHIDGDVRGEEDLLIEGEVSGTVNLKNNSLTIGPKGKVRADVYAHSIYVDGYRRGRPIRLRARQRSQERDGRGQHHFAAREPRGWREVQGRDRDGSASRAERRSAIACAQPKSCTAAAASRGQARRAAAQALSTGRREDGSCELKNSRGGRCTAIE